MTFLGAKRKADEAATSAKRAFGTAEDIGVQELAHAVQYLSEAIAELSRSLHNSSIG